MPVARELIATGRTERPVTGFKGRSGRSFRARLALQQGEDAKWRVEFDEPWAREGAKAPEADEATEPAKKKRRRGSRGGRGRKKPTKPQAGEEEEHSDLEIPTFLRRQAD